MADQKDGEIPNNVVPLRRGSDAAIASLRQRKNAFFDKLLGPEQVNYKTGESSYDDEPEDNSHLVPNEEGFGVKQAGPNTSATIINHMNGRGNLEELNTGLNEAKIISMGKYKENRDMKRMENPDA